MSSFASSAGSYMMISDCSQIAMSIEVKAIHVLERRTLIVASAVFGEQKKC
jgi:hypothetical protein